MGSVVTGMVGVDEVIVGNVKFGFAAGGAGVGGSAGGGGVIVDTVGEFDNFGGDDGVVVDVGVFEGEGFFDELVELFDMPV
ncbi:hypothetical protein AGMMS49556_10300 [Endomicrobiia bacterium]|nr:hypothetical protein AGMMS49556_10300 [Endomicrobiia bacterium]